MSKGGITSDLPVLLFLGSFWNFPYYRYESVLDVKAYFETLEVTFFFSTVEVSLLELNINTQLCKIIRFPV